MTKVAVYGSLRDGMGNNRLLDGSVMLSRTRTKRPYKMYSLGGFPRVALNSEPVCPIVIEVYEVDDKTLDRLNSLEGYRGEDGDNFYNRSEIETEDGQVALIYHIEDGGEYGGNRSQEVVENGDWVDYVFSRRHNNRYY